MVFLGVDLHLFNDYLSGRLQFVNINGGVHSKAKLCSLPTAKQFPSIVKINADDTIPSFSADFKVASPLQAISETNL